MRVCGGNGGGSGGGCGSGGGGEPGSLSARFFHSKSAYKAPSHI